MKLKPASVQSETRQEIQSRVDKKTHGLIEDLEVAIVRDIVVLSGRTSTYYSKQLATEAVRSAADGLELSNEILVNATSD